MPAQSRQATQRKPAAKAGGARSSINLRVEPQTRALIDDAAAALGKTRTEFMIDSARRDAVDVLLDQRLFILGDEDFDAFAAALSAPTPPDPKLTALLKRVPPWER